MSALKTTTGEPVLRRQAITHDQARALLGQVMGFVAVTVGFIALGAYLGGDLSGATGLLLFVGAFACIIGLNIAAAKGPTRGTAAHPAPCRPARCRRRRGGRGPVSRW